MKRRGISLLFLLLLLIMSNGVEADTFTGTGNSTTGTFESNKYTKITWSYTAENEFDSFSSFIYEEGDSTYTDSFDGVGGTTYLYESGTFYFDVTTANVAEWTITTTETNGEYLSNGDTITGSQDKTTKLIESNGEVTFDWSYTTDNDFDTFSVFVYELGGSIYETTFSGEEGTSNLYQEGTFYLQILAANIVEYSITVDIAPPESDSSTEPSDTDTSTSSDQSDTTPSDDPTDSEDNKEDQDDQLSDTSEAPFFWMSMVVIPVIKIIRNKRRKH